MRAHLIANALFAIIREDLPQLPDHRVANASIPMGNILMGAFAMFSLKDSSLQPSGVMRNPKACTMSTAWV